VIVSKLPPSWFFGAFATVIHSKAFNCFVSTARHPFLWRRWTTRLYLGDPGVDRHFKTHCTVLYSASLSKSEVHEVHDELSQRLDLYGSNIFGSSRAEDGGDYEFSCATSYILDELCGRGVIERILE
jgi:hypothetical protein